MLYAITTATKKIASLKKRIRFIPGGTSAGKTVGIDQFLIDLAQRDTSPTLTSIVSESLPHLKRGAMKDFLDILKNHNYYQEERWNKTDFIYTFETGSKIEFFGVDQPSKVHGPRRDRLFINEGNYIPFETYEQLELRTNEFIIVDCNPSSEFWMYTDVIPNNDVDILTLTYKDNEALNPAIVQSIETRIGRKGWWQVYGLGQLGEVEGKIYENWPILDDVPPEARLERRWLDFGYTNDPTAIGDLYKWNDAYVLDEQLYQKGLSNKQIADFLVNLKPMLTVADSAEPKSIDEIKSFGINIIPSVKGKDSVKHGTQIVQDQRIFVTKRSVNIIKENRNYLWLVDRDGKVLNVEDPLCANHHMSGIRYAVTSLVPIIRKQEFWNSIPQWPEKEESNPAR